MNKNSRICHLKPKKSQPDIEQTAVLNPDKTGDTLMKMEVAILEAHN